jgi:3-(methylthio)propanoyl-CoA dehydrogenase
VIAEIKATAAGLKSSAEPSLPVIGAELERAIGALLRALDWMVPTFGSDPREAFAGSVPYLRLWGVVCGGWQMGRAALIAARKLGDGEGDADFMRAKIVTARYYADALLPQAQSLASEVTQAGESTLALAAAQF